MTTPEGPSDGGPAEAAETTIIRYPNRRLYDRSQGRYVTLQDVAETVRRARDRHRAAYSKGTGEDLTRPILMQILLERHPERMELFPVPFLHLALRANDVMLGFLREYARRSLAYAELDGKRRRRQPAAGPHGMDAGLPAGLAAARRIPAPRREG